MRITVIIILIALISMAQSQDFELMDKYIKNFNEKMFPSHGFTIDEKGDTTFWWRITFVDSPDCSDVSKSDYHTLDLDKLKKEYLKIYIDEYLRMIARKFLDAEFNRPELSHLKIIEEDSVAWDYTKPTTLGIVKTTPEKTILQVKTNIGSPIEN